VHHSSIIWLAEFLIATRELTFPSEKMIPRSAKYLHLPENPPLAESKAVLARRSSRTFLLEGPLPGNFTPLSSSGLSMVRERFSCFKSRASVTQAWIFPPMVMPPASMGVFLPATQR
jgi:hypothetical protein